eukprot:2771443-Rhodomonas_salina.1
MRAGGLGLDEEEWLALAHEAAYQPYGHWCRRVKWAKPAKEEHGTPVDTIDVACQQFHECQVFIVPH